MAILAGDFVEVDRLGLPFHRHWGVVKEVDGVEAVVQLVHYSRLRERYMLDLPLKFETWELRLLDRPGVTR